MPKKKYKGSRGWSPVGDRALPTPGPLPKPGQGEPYTAPPPRTTAAGDPAPEFVPAHLRGAQRDAKGRMVAARPWQSPSERLAMRVAAHFRAAAGEYQSAELAELCESSAELDRMLAAAVLLLELADALEAGRVRVAELPAAAPALIRPDVRDLLGEVRVTPPP